MLAMMPCGWRKWEGGFRYRAVPAVRREQEIDYVMAIMATVGGWIRFLFCPCGAEDSLCPPCDVSDQPPIRNTRMSRCGRLYQ